MYVPVGRQMLGRVVSSLGEPIDGRAGLRSGIMPSMPTRAMSRLPIEEPLSLGVQAIDAFHTIGQVSGIGLQVRAWARVCCSA
ncbi:MAG: hypothetical protein R3E58_09005 [Phycisphaerae bacterium]